ncbi:MAG TPA: isomerase, partial [Aliiroseovarius sp.]|nr:isomerase [Aliiroseovarius sp.]
ALFETGLPMLGLNTARGGRGEFGLSALPGREVEARAAIDDALSYAVAINAGSGHVMAGMATGDAARGVFCDNLEYACERAAPHGITILVEALNPHDVPGYFLASPEQAAELVERFAIPNLKLMFDCYHVGRSGGRVPERLQKLLPLIGHIQFARVPDRGPPIGGDVDYPTVFEQIDALGWSRPLGAEYIVDGETEATLQWMDP